MASATILNLYKNAILGPNDPNMAKVYLHTKFCTNIIIDHRVMAQKYKPKMAAAAILNFSNVGWATVILVWPLSVCTPNLSQNIYY